MEHETAESAEHSRVISIILCGDVMTGRGIDQVLPHPSDPRIHERYVRSALGYVEIAEEVNGKIVKPVDFSYIWGDALEQLDRSSADLRIINLETAITKSDDHWKGKGIHYRMHPKNTPCLAAAKIDCSVLANNHVLDWGFKGLSETIVTLKDSGLKTVGAGESLAEAAAPAVMDVADKGRVIVFAFGSPTSGVPLAWAASKDRPGVNLLKDLSRQTAERISAQVRAVKRPGDIVIASIHWGSNWGYTVPDEQVKFAHRLIDDADVDIVHGHSSHHPRAVEVYKNKPILYGCGDFLNDYEGISGYESFRDDLTLMYLVKIDPARAKLVEFQMIPFQIKRFRLNRALEKDVRWLGDVLDREGRKFGTRVDVNDDHSLAVRWETR